MEDSRSVAALSSALARRIGAKRFDLWFGTQAKICARGAHLTIQAASTFHSDCLRKQFADDIRTCWEAVLCVPGTVVFEVNEALSGAEQAGQNGATDRLAKTSGNNGDKPDTTIHPTKFEHRSESTFASFVMGASNEYAFRAAELLARGRQQANLVMFSGPTGVGKTHLLRALQREYRRRRPHGTAIYMTAEQFTTHFIEAIRVSGLPSFRQKCRGAQLLLIDDLQFFAGKARTIEELQHTIDTLLAEGRQLAVSSDRSLGELRSLGPELCSRLAGGLTCEIEPPEFLTRKAILCRMAEEIRLELDDAVAMAVASQITAGARELRGALYRLQAMSLADNTPITRESAERALADLLRHSTRPVRLADVQQAVCKVFGVEPAELRSERKDRALAEPRMLAMWLARKHTRAAWSEIGQYFGRRSHSTVISAHRRVERLIGVEAEIGVSHRSCKVEEAIRNLESALRSA